MAALEKAPRDHAGFTPDQKVSDSRHRRAERSDNLIYAPPVAHPSLPPIEPSFFPPPPPRVSMDMGTSSMAGMSGMDMSSMSMPSMTSMAMSAQPSATASASHAMSSMGGMGSMSMDMGGMGSMSGMGSGSMGDMHGMDGMDMGAGACKMSMVGNWNTIDTCILSPSWQYVVALRCLAYRS